MFKRKQPAKKSGMELLLGKARKGKLHRPHTPDSVKLTVALQQGIACGCGCGELVFEGQGQLHHWPALENRIFDPSTKEYMPAANNPKFMRFLITDHHDKKTNGPGGTKRITTKGGDNHTARHTGNLSAKESGWQDRMAKAGKPVVPRRFA